MPRSSLITPTGGTRRSLPVHPSARWIRPHHRNRRVRRRPAGTGCGSSASSVRAARSRTARFALRRALRAAGAASFTTVSARPTSSVASRRSARARLSGSSSSARCGRLRRRVLPADAGVVRPNPCGGMPYARAPCRRGGRHLRPGPGLQGPSPQPPRSARAEVVGGQHIPRDRPSPQPKKTSDPESKASRARFRSAAEDPCDALATGPTKPCAAPLSTLPLTLVRHRRARRDPPRQEPASAEKRDRLGHP